MSHADKAGFGCSRDVDEYGQFKPVRNGFFAAMTIGLILMWYDAMTKGTFNSAIGIVIFSGMAVYFASHLRYQKKWK